MLNPGRIWVESAMRHLPRVYVFVIAQVLLALGASPVRASLTAEEQGRLDKQLAELADLMSYESLNAVQWARGTYVATRFFAWGSDGVPQMVSRFQGTKNVYTATLSGLFTSLHGNDRDRMELRRALEQDARKQHWLRAYFGSRKDMHLTVEEGLGWKKLTRVLPSTGGLHRFALLCLQSEDILVRRLGLFWGFWTPSPAYDTALRRAAKADPDPETRYLANYLLRRS